MKIEIAYASKAEQVLLEVSVEEGATIESAILQSGILQQFPEIDLAQNKVGIFSKIKTLTHTLKKGDRVEIYRALEINPKEARRLRAAK